MMSLPNPNPGSKLLVDRRHPEYLEFCQTHQWLLDSLEGGSRYRDAVYQSRDGLVVHNLIRHAREIPQPQDRQGLIQGGRAETLAGQLQAGIESNYELRRTRTPVPNFVAEVVDKYCSRIYNHEIKRDYGDPPNAPKSPRPNPTPNPVPRPGSVLPSGPGSAGPRSTTPDAAAPLTFPVQVQPPAPVEPPRVQDQYGQALEEFWLDCDGAGTSIDHWMAETVAPVLLTLGQLDLVISQKPTPAGVRIDSQADVTRHGLDRPVASYILPENMLWWRLDPTLTRYEECLTREFVEDQGGTSVVQYRHWLPGLVTLLDDRGQEINQYRTGMAEIPIIRVFDRKKVRCRNTGQSRMVVVAEIQRDYYNRDSELIMADVMQATPPLSGPVDFLTGSNEVTVGPGWVLPKFPDGKGSYVGWDYVRLDKSGDESLRKNLDRRRDEADRATCMTKPAGAAGSGSGTVSQSGISKQLDQVDGNNLLSKISRAFGRAEDRLATLYLRVRFGEPLTPAITDRIKIVYPTRFNLLGSGEILDLIAQFQRVLAGSGTMPVADGAMLQIAIRQILVGFDDDAMIPIDAEIEAHVANQNALRNQRQDQDQESLLGQADQEGQYPGQYPGSGFGSPNVVGFRLPG